VSERRNGGFFVSAIPGGNLNQREKPSMNTKLAIRVGTNPDHHLWNNNGTWWCYYTEHLPDCTKRRVRRSLWTPDRTTARLLRGTNQYDFWTSSWSDAHFSAANFPKKKEGRTLRCPLPLLSRCNFTFSGIF